MTDTFKGFHPIEKDGVIVLLISESLDPNNIKAIEAILSKRGEVVLMGLGKYKEHVASLLEQDSKPVYYSNAMSDGTTIKSLVPFPSAVSSTPIMDCFDVFENEEQYLKWQALTAPKKDAD